MISIRRFYTLFYAIIIRRRWLNYERNDDIENKPFIFNGIKLQEKVFSRISTYYMPYLKHMLYSGLKFSVAETLER